MFSQKTVRQLLLCFSFLITSFGGLFSQNCTDVLVTIAPDPAVPFSDCCLFIDIDNATNNVIKYFKIENPAGFALANVNTFNGWTIGNSTSTEVEIFPDTPHLQSGFYNDYVRFCMSDVSAFPQTLDITFYMEDMSGNDVVYCTQPRNMDCPLTPSCTVDACMTTNALGNASYDFFGNCSSGNGTVTYSWDFGDGNSSTLQNPTHSYPLVLATYNACLTVTNDLNGVTCTDTECNTINISCNLRTSWADTIAICEGDLTILDPMLINAIGNATYVWTPSTGLTDPNVANPMSSPIVNTWYFVNIQDEAGCTHVDSIFIDVENIIFHLNDTITLCPWDTYTPTTVVNGGAGQFNYNWSPGIGLSDSTILNPTISATNETYSLIITDENGCSEENNTLIEVDSCCTLVVQMKDSITICEGVSQLLHLGVSGGQGMVTYSWSPGGSLNDSTLLNPTATPNISTIYTLTATDEYGCTDSQELVIIVEDCCPIEVMVPDTITACLTVGVQLSAQVNGAQGNVTYNWIPNTGLTDPTIANPFASPSATTTYIVFVEDDLGCRANDTIIVETEPCCEIQLDYATLHKICQNANVVLGGTVFDNMGGITYDWQPTTGLSDPTLANPSASPDTTTTYILTATDSLGCMISESITVIIDQCDCSELVFNGDFEKGDTEFMSDLVNDCNCIANSYCITSTATNKCTNNPWQNILAPGGSGDYMVVDGQNQMTTWLQDVTVFANQPYYFCFDYFPNVSTGGTPLLSIDIHDQNGFLTSIGSTNGTANSWSTYCAAPWQTPNAGTYQIRIVQMDAPQFSDYGIDNISFSCDPDLVTTAELQVNLGVKIYPNPVSSELQISTDRKALSFELFTAEGKIIRLGNIDDQSATTRINLEQVPDGIYFLKVGSKELGYQWKKVIKL